MLCAVRVVKCEQSDLTQEEGRAPLIVTALLPPDLFAEANQLRKTHFPAERNFLDAHVTLFHALPPASNRELRELLSRLAREHRPPKAKLTGAVSLGRGTALALDSPPLLALRDIIADRFHGLLTAQDQHRPRLHITVQNKVRPDPARELLNELRSRIVPREFTFVGLAMHAYLGGPWAAQGEWRFAS